MYNRTMHTVERLCVEVNSRVSYPIKSVLLAMLENNEISLDNEMHKYCISWFIINVANIGMSIFLSSWNQQYTFTYNKFIYIIIEDYFQEDMLMTLLKK